MPSERRQRAQSIAKRLKLGPTLYTLFCDIAAYPVYYGSTEAWAQSFGISVQAVRKALRRLQGRELIEDVPRDELPPAVRNMLAGRPRARVWRAHHRLGFPTPVGFPKETTLSGANHTRAPRGRGGFGRRGVPAPPRTQEKTLLTRPTQRFRAAKEQAMETAWREIAPPDMSAEALAQAKRDGKQPELMPPVDPDDAALDQAKRSGLQPRLKPVWIRDYASAGLPSFWIPHIARMIDQMCARLPEVAPECWPAEDWMAMALAELRAAPRPPQRIFGYLSRILWRWRLTGGEYDDLEHCLSNLEARRNLRMISPAWNTDNPRWMRDRAHRHRRRLSGEPRRRHQSTDGRDVVRRR